MDINADAIKYGYIDYLFLCLVFFARAAAPLHHPADRTARARFAFSLPSRRSNAGRKNDVGCDSLCSARALQRGIEILADSSSVA